MKSALSTTFPASFVIVSFPIRSKAPALCGFDAAWALAFIDKNRISADIGKKKTGVDSKPLYDAGRSLII
ncbi:MAG: hypothetical protein ACR65R_01625 [Methylomicrobium sp.]